MRRVLALSVILSLAQTLAPTPALSDPVTTSPRPPARPGSAEPQVTQTATPQASLAPRVSLRPLPRPGAAAERAEELAVQVSAPIARATTPSRDRKGSVCKNPALRGTPVEPIKGRLQGCGIEAPVQVTSVHGVTLHPAATLNCTAANALAQWVQEGLQPAFRNQVVQLNVADSYSCRPRNNVRGNPVSVHGKGDAIDISGFVLRSGKILTVSGDYGSQIKRAKKAACGTFNTTLGPGSDGYHENHIHLDVARHGGSPYCR